MIKTPKAGLKGLIENWQSDLLAALSVSLVALPLSLGIAYASGVPPMSGVLAAIIGGIVTTFFRGSHIAINGPAAGLIAVILASVATLDDGSGQAINYTLAAIVVSGAIQIILGVFKLGRFADLFHSTVIQGMLAAIGIIIFAKQIHIAMGTQSNSSHIIETLIDAFYQIPNINPFVGVISLLGLLLLIFHSKINHQFFHFLPAPMWVLVLAIPFVYLFDFFNAHTIDFLGTAYAVGPELLVNIPDNLADAILHPNFAKIGTLPFWTSVASITIIASIASLASGKAIDKLDPYKRKTDMNKDLIGIGLSTMVSGLLGGLTITNVIVRSTVNVHNHAKTKWSNFYHGILILLFVFLLAPVIQLVPLCALAILLVFTGFKLASPRVFKHVYNHGIEQLVFFIFTLVVTLYTNLLIGIFCGLGLVLLTHILLAKINLIDFFKLTFNSGTNLILKKDETYELRINGIANFLATLNIDNLLHEIPTGATVKIDLSKALMVDFSVMEHLDEFQRSHLENGGKVAIMGLEKHVASTNHRLALRILTSFAHKLSPRQIWLQEIAKEHDYHYQKQPDEAPSYFKSFYFFKSRPIEEEYNCISDKDEDTQWEIFDATFEEGAFMSVEEYQTTLGILKVENKIPRFTIEKKGFLDRYLHLSEHKDIDYKVYHDFSSKYIVKVESKEEMKAFLSDELRQFFENSDISHLESNGEAILIFNNELRLAKISEYLKIIKLIETLTEFFGLQQSGEKAMAKT